LAVAKLNGFQGFHAGPIALAGSPAVPDVPFGPSKNLALELDHAPKFMLLQSRYLQIFLTNT